jgi:hypothetical protein
VGTFTEQTWGFPRSLITTAVQLRVLDIQARWGVDKIIWSETMNVRGADLVCWDCVDGEVLVWEMKAEDQALSKALDSLEKGKRWAQKQALANGRKVVAGPAFDHPSTGTAGQNADKIVTVYSDTEGNDGVEWYNVKEDEKVYTRGHIWRDRADEAADISVMKNKEFTKKNARAIIDNDKPIKSDPVSDVLICGTIGLGVAAGGWLGISALSGGSAAAAGSAGGFELAAGGAATGSVGAGAAAVLTQSMFDLAG